MVLCIAWGIDLNNTVKKDALVPSNSKNAKYSTLLLHARSVNWFFFDEVDPCLIHTPPVLADLVQSSLLHNFRFVLLLPLGGVDLFGDEDVSRCGESVAGIGNDAY